MEKATTPYVKIKRLLRLVSSEKQRSVGKALFVLPKFRGCHAFLKAGSAFMKTVGRTIRFEKSLRLELNRVVQLFPDFSAVEARQLRQELKILIK